MANGKEQMANVKHFEFCHLPFEIAPGAGGGGGWLKGGTIPAWRRPYAGVPGAVYTVR
jgi:hypothetical protein